MKQTQATARTRSGLESGTRRRREQLIGDRSTRLCDNLFVGVSGESSDDSLLTPGVADLLANLFLPPTKTTRVDEIAAGIIPAKVQVMNCRDAPLLRQGWASLALWIAFGILIEGLIGFRIPALVDDPIRRDMLRLAHAHGTLLNLVLLTAAICARLEMIQLTRFSALNLRLAALILPIGFLFAGLWHYRDDPGLGIFLVPIGAVLLLVAVIATGMSGKR